MDSNLFTSLGGGFHTQFAKQAEACFTYTTYMHLQLQEIKSNNLPFGGVNIIAVGDLYQLKPVMGQFIFEVYKTNCGPLATNLWTEHFKIFELDEIMRQKEDKKFAQLLNRLCIGNHNKDDIYLL